MERPTALTALLLCSGYLLAIALRPAAADPTACSLLTQSDIETVLHVKDA